MGSIKKSIFLLLLLCGLTILTFCTCIAMLHASKQPVVVGFCLDDLEETY